MRPSPSGSSTKSFINGGKRQGLLPAAFSLRPILAYLSEMLSVQQDFIEFLEHAKTEEARRRMEMMLAITEAEISLLRWVLGENPHFEFWRNELKNLDL